MRLSIKLKMGIAIVMVALMPIIFGVVILEGSIFSYIEETLDDRGIMPTYEDAMERHNLFLDLVKEQIRTDEGDLNHETLSYLDSNKSNDLLGFYVQIDGNEIYRSPWMKTLEFEMYEYEELGLLDDSDAAILNSTEVVTLEHSYAIYTLYNLNRINDAFNKYAGIVIIGAVTLFALFVFLLILWVFRHIRASMKQLIAMTENILAGDLKTPVPYNQKDEFRGLANTINTLRSDLYDSNLEKEHLEKERERMLANIAHDIKTPITAIKGCAQMLSEDIISDEATKKDYLGIILSRSHVIEHMVNDLKEVIKYDVGSINLEFADVKMGYFIDDCIDDFRINHQEQRFNITFEKKYEDLILCIDPNLIQRVFKNIIGNSLKYNRDREVDVRIDTDKVGNTIRFRISDDGVGVPDDALANLFDRLYRVDSSRNSKIEGSGIGLSICKEIIEAHKGKIWAENENGRFSILFSIPVTGE